MKNIEINAQRIIFFTSIILIVCIYSIFYSHSDLNHTARSSLAILSGHITDFYEFNKVKMGANDYLPFIYWLFAAWNFPFCTFLIDCNTSPILSLSELIVQKTLLALLFGISLRAIYLISKEITKIGGAINNVTLFYATSTVMLFCIFAFNQYDIVGIVFSLYGLVFLFRSNLLKFSLLFSVAISIKYFAAIAYLPILLISEKRLGRVILYGLLASGFTFLQIFFYRDSPIFMGSFYALALKKISADNGSSSLLPSLAAVTSYFAIIAGCWLYKPKDSVQKLRACLIAVILSYLILFLKVDWHPQWISIIAPYLALTLLFEKNIRLNLLFQFLFSSTYLLLVVSRYPNNLDNFLLGAGFFRDYFGYSHIPIVTLYKSLNFKWISWCFYFSIIYFLLKVISSKNIKVAHINLPMQTIVLWLSNSVFLIPSFIIAFSAPTYLLRFDQTADLRNKEVVMHVNVGGKGKYLGEIKKGDRITQFFNPNQPNLAAISIIFGTYHKVSNSQINLEIYTKKEIIYSTILDFTKIYPNMLTTIRDINAGDRCNDGCYISLDVISGEQELELWHEIYKNEQPSNYFYLNHEKITGSFILEEFYKK
jgi:hypothetical protein